MNNPYFNSDFLTFFKELATNNNKTWFDANRKRYEKQVKNPFKNFVTELISQMREVDAEIEIEAKDAIFRINRDIRFSKDKTPYKLSCSAIISPGGKKNKEVPGLHIEAGAAHFNIYGGVYQLSKNNLEDLRYYIAAKNEEFSGLINAKAFRKKYDGIHGDKNKRIPKDLIEAAEKQPLIFNKSFYFFAQLDANTILKSDLMDIVLNHYKAGQPIANFIRKAIHY